MASKTAVARTLPETVEVPSDLVIEAIAALDAISGYLAERVGLTQAESSALSDWAGNKGGSIQGEVFGLGPDLGDEYDVDPVVVSVEAREAELEADIIDRVVSESYLHGRREKLRSYAQRIRQHGQLVTFDEKVGGDA